MSNVVVVGLQWGDEGKGKVVDLLGEGADCVVRFGGGANAGHTLIVDGEKVVFHLLPSGMLRPECRCVLGAGMVLDPDELVREIQKTRELGVLDDPSRLMISMGANLVLPFHKLLDAMNEEGVGSIGTTLRGIGPAYEDRVGRRGVWVGLLRDMAGFKRAVKPALERAEALLSQKGKKSVSLEEIIAAAEKWAEELKPFLGDAERFLREESAAGRHILFEGAQGTLLDVGFGTYPYVTSSATLAGGACVGAGVGPTRINSVVGVVKVYTTRVGEGPFATELKSDEGKRLQTQGGEIGATTGRPRRCGWLDIPALKRSVSLNGVDGVAVTKLDVLSGFNEIPVCVAYELNGRRVEDFPASFEDVGQITPIYEKLPGWREDLSECRSMDELPEEARNYLNFIESQVGADVVLVSLGPARKQSIILRKVFL